MRHRVIALLALCASAPAAWTETCQENFNLTIENFPLTTTQLLGIVSTPLPNGAGVDCEIGVHSMAPGLGGSRTVRPPNTHVDTVDYTTPAATAPRLIERTLRIRGQFGGLNVTVYRHIFDKVVSSAARGPELDVVLEYPTGQPAQIAVLWRSFAYGQSADWQGQVTRLAQMPYTQQSDFGTVWNVRMDANGEPRPEWGAKVDFYLSNGTTVVQQSRNLSNQYSRTPRIRLGAVNALYSGVESLLILKHRVCSVIDHTGAEQFYCGSD